MDLYDVMRTTFSAREFTDDPVPDEVLERIFENARFASSGGNRQGWHVIVIREQATKDAIADLTERPAKVYTAQALAGEASWNSLVPTALDPATIEATRPWPALSEPLRRAPVLLVVCVDLWAVASLDKDLDRVGIISGASIYPFAWNILLAARNEGYGGTLTTVAIAEEPRLKALLGIPDHVAVCAVIPMGRPVKQLTKLRRNPVATFVSKERWSRE